MQGSEEILRRLQEQREAGSVIDKDPAVMEDSARADQETEDFNDEEYTTPEGVKEALKLAMSGGDSRIPEDEGMSMNPEDSEYDLPPEIEDILRQILERSDQVIPSTKVSPEVTGEEPEVMGETEVSDPSMGALEGIGSDKDAEMLEKLKSIKQ
tara:strand:+ start:6040 stop:6501 length:462 start_codon:yes stop_codon:yes gene_type:complete